MASRNIFSMTDFDRPPGNLFEDKKRKDIAPIESVHISPKL